MSLNVYIYLNPKNWKGFIPKLVKYGDKYFNLHWGCFTFVIVGKGIGECNNLHLGCTLSK